MRFLDARRWHFRRPSDLVSHPWLAGRVHLALRACTCAPNQHLHVARLPRRAGELHRLRLTTRKRRRLRRVPLTSLGLGELNDPTRRLHQLPPPVRRRSCNGRSARQLHRSPSRVALSLASAHPTHPLRSAQRGMHSPQSVLQRGVSFGQLRSPFRIHPESESPRLLVSDRFRSRCRLLLRIRRRYLKAFGFQTPRPGFDCRLLLAVLRTVVRRRERI